MFIKMMSTAKDSRWSSFFLKYSFSRVDKMFERRHLKIDNLKTDDVAFI